MLHVHVTDNILLRLYEAVVIFLMYFNVIECTLLLHKLRFFLFCFASACILRPGCHWVQINNMIDCFYEVNESLFSQHTFQNSTKEMSGQSQEK